MTARLRQAHAGEFHLQPCRGEVHESSDLGDRQATFRNDEENRHRRRLIVGQHDHETTVPHLAVNLLRQNTEHAVAINGRLHRRFVCIHRQARLNAHGSGHPSAR